ncbi:MAG: hypothetical protein IH901_01815 [Proteobacteria bacterium]|nr:hypothetical protein [Pseudomonadota bacterium]
MPEHPKTVCFLSTAASSRPPRNFWRKRGELAQDIDRRHGRDGAGATVVLYGPIDYDFRFESMAEFTRAHKGETG